MWECKSWRLYKRTNIGKQRIREQFPYRRSLVAKQLLKETTEREIFGYLQCNIEVPKKLRSKIANFSSLIKKTLISSNDIGELLRKDVEEQGKMSHFWIMLIPSFTLLNGTVITPLLLFHMHLGLACTKTHRSLEYTPETCFNSRQWTQEDKVTRMSSQKQ